MKRFRIYIDPEQDVVVYKNSLVKNPAHEQMKYAFSKDVPVAYEFDDTKQNIVGVAIIPEKPIYRNSPEMGEHEVVFMREDIEQMAYAYGERGYWNELTFDHDDSKPVKSAVMYLSYIIDRANGFSVPDAFSDLPDGTWILGYHFKDAEEYQFAKDNFTGWSIEGDFFLEEININNNKMDKRKSVFSELFALAKKIVKSEFASATLADGTVVEWEGDLAEGTALFVVVEEGEAIPAPDGEHVLEDGRVVVTVEGIVTQIVEAVEEEAQVEEATEEMSEETTDQVEEVDQTAEAFAAIVSMIEKQVETTETMRSEFAAIRQENSELKERLAKLETAPAVEPEKKKFARTEENPRLRLMMEQVKGN
jgi:hypothetical protein